MVVLPAYKRLFAIVTNSSCCFSLGLLASVVVLSSCFFFPCECLFSNGFFNAIVIIQVVIAYNFAYLSLKSRSGLNGFVMCSLSTITHAFVAIGCRLGFLGILD